MSADVIDDVNVVTGNGVIVHVIDRFMRVILHRSIQVSKKESKVVQRGDGDGLSTFCTVQSANVDGD